MARDPTARLLAAIADPIRLEIDRQLSLGADVCACDFDLRGHVAQPTVSHHLRILRSPVFPGSDNTLHWGLDDPSDVEGSAEEKRDAFRRTQMEVSARLRPFIEVALRAAGRSRGAAVAG
jgi:hypothetical protein